MLYCFAASCCSSGGGAQTRDLRWVRLAANMHPTPLVDAVPAGAVLSHCALFSW